MNALFRRKPLADLQEEGAHSTLRRTLGAFYLQPANWTPFMPNGWHGVWSGAAIVFFAYGRRHSTLAK